MTSFVNIPSSEYLYHTLLNGIFQALDHHELIIGNICHVIYELYLKIISAFNSDSAKFLLIV